MHWIFSYDDNAVAMNVVGYDSNNSVAYQKMKAGTRYIYQINVDNTAQTVTLIGQARGTIVMPWTDLWP